MDLGGPVWHASVKGLKGPGHPRELRRLARRVLEGVGDRRLGEWEEKLGAFHLRRRLSVAEEQLVGPVVDVRGTSEARRRLALVPAERLAHAPAEILAEEMGS